MEQKSTANKSTKPRSFTGFAVVFMALTLVIAIVLNLLASRLNIVWDMTPTGMYKLTDTSRDYLKKLDKDVNFYFLLDMDLLSTDTSSMALYHALEEYAACDRINFVSFEPDNDPEQTQKLQDLGYTLSRGDIVIECEGRSKHIPASSMYQSYIDADTNLVDSMYFAGENYITGAIDAVVSGRETAIYFLTGHGEKSLTEDYSVLAKNLANRNYRTSSLDLTTADSVPEDAAIVILAAPKTDISKDEYRLLSEYLDQGGNVCFWMSPNDEAMKYTNIDALLESFGLRMDYDIVAETDSSQHISGDPHTFRCNVVVSDDEEKADLTSGVLDLVNSGIVPFMSNTRSFYQFADTSDASVEVGSLLQTVQNGTDALGNASSTAVGEPYGGTDLNDKITGQVLDLAMYATSTLRQDAKVMVMGNAEFIDDANVSQDYMIVPVNLMLSVFSWMYDSDTSLDMGIADKERTYDSMLLNSETAANTTNIVFVVVPVLVGLVGAGVWLKRRYS
ncbi:MAG: GldG family protein [Oscillospiraceae bacterium]|nr:GldG family protein [Oscillospiraceae bacterium]